MAFVITQNCCTDASCVPVCPVDCIRPVPGDRGSTTPMLYIDPTTCVDCGACAEVCPVTAICHEDDLPPTQRRYKQINAEYFAAAPLTIRSSLPVEPARPVERGSLKVAVVGTGPAACYAVADLVRTGGVDVNVFEKLPTPYGLVRFGVAPDHQPTKDVVREFEAALGHRDVSCYFNVTVGNDLTHDDLAADHHAVIYAVGASQSKGLGIAGDHLSGNHAAADVVGWYNGHPERASDTLDLSGPRTVIVGNGNVALDVARILVMDREALARTDIADHALSQLSTSGIEEVVVLGRRGAADAAFSSGELLALGALDGVDVVIEGHLGERPADFEGALKYDLVNDYAGRPPRPGRRRIVLRFGARPVEIVGDGRVEGLVIADRNGRERLATPLVVRSIGYTGSPIAGLPFDDAAGIVPNVGGRVMRGQDPIPGAYVTGWIKRGPRGVIGTNRECARQTVTNLLADARAGRSSTNRAGSERLLTMLSSRESEIVDWAAWRRIDAIERQRGSTSQRPRVKLADLDALLAASKA
ncbi:4Fe-4S dicluster domain-containing protein [Mycobacterium sp. 050134]|uniref:4Fe-4S dicluster domain-containing protein n=1 Tax=Mycobacterium sp. 050134 TaxID=3096111 RepID=UPI002EDA2A85